MDSSEESVNELMKMANKITTKIAYKVGALGYGLLGTLSVEEALPGEDKEALDKTSLDDLLKKLGCVMNSLDRLQNNYLNSKETNEIRRHIRRIKDIEIVSKENKKILKTWLKWRRGAFLRAKRGDCSYNLKY